MPHILLCIAGVVPEAVAVPPLPIPEEVKVPMSPTRHETRITDPYLSDLSDDGTMCSPCGSFYDAQPQPWYVCIVCGPVDIFGTPVVCPQCNTSFNSCFDFYDRRYTVSR